MYRTCGEVLHGSYEKLSRVLALSRIRSKWSGSLSGAARPASVAALSVTARGLASEMPRTSGAAARALPRLLARASRTAWLHRLSLAGRTAIVSRVAVRLPGAPGPP